MLFVNIICDYRRLCTAPLKQQTSIIGLFHDRPVPAEPWSLPTPDLSDPRPTLFPSSRPFYCDAVLNGVDNTEQMNNCEEWRDNLALDPLICAPWSEVYGMFMGDGSSTPVELTVTSMVGSDKGYILGNYLIGKGEFSHVYSAPRDNPFIAYFTGGDRVYECNDGNVHMSSEGNCELEVELMLNNNAEGRFRLETAIWLGTGHVNRSPRVSMIPVIPLPRGTAALPRSRFQVTRRAGMSVVARLQS